MIQKLVNLIVFVGIVQLSTYAQDDQDSDIKNFLIVANAPVSRQRDFDWNFIDVMRRTHKIVSLDGASNLFARAGKKPDVILGDFDSIEAPEIWGIQATFFTILDSSPSYLGKDGIVIVPAKDQDLTDLAKAIMYCDKMRAKSIYIVNAHGGRMDHELGNYSLLRQYYNKNRPILIRTISQTLEFFKTDIPATIKITGRRGDYCGIIGFPNGKIITMKGFMYNADNYPLEMLKGSTCNKINGLEAEVTITGEVLIIHPNAGWIRSKL